MAKLKELATPYSDGAQPHFSQYTIVTEGIGASIASTATCRNSRGSGSSHTKTHIKRLPP